MSAQAAQQASSRPSYDEVPYESFSYPQTHPTHLRAIASLFGLNPPEIANARVLELGCASGGNLFPIAAVSPKAHFLGIDLSQEQIARAKKINADLGLKNVEFLQQDILNFAPPSKEKFDYIICHGIFSWVPANVQEAVLKLCNEWLSPDGIALISYNALPGWNAVRSLREMMLYHTNRFTRPDEKVQQARLLLDFLSESVPEGKSGYRSIIDEERALLKNINNTYLYHDHLESTNAQFYLHDFVTRANTHNLSYVGDSNLAWMYVDNMPPKAAETLKAINDIVAQEQYMDFILNRRFRSTILCRADRPLNRNLRREQIMDYFLTINPAMEISGDDPKKDITFKIGPNSFTTHEETTGTLFLELAACGNRAIAATDLVARVQKKLNLPSPDPVREVLMSHGLPLVLKGYVLLRSDSPDFAAEVSDKPVAFPLARMEASMPGRNSVTNVLGHSLPSDIVGSAVLKNLDGTKTRDDIAGILTALVKNGTLKMERNGAPITDEEEIRRNAGVIFDDLLPRMARSAVLVG